MVSASETAPHGLVGQSPQIRQVRQLIEKISRSRSPVLLLGETGVGKEVVASAIHTSNPQGHFVPIECGSLVGALMESELFGHTKGAFTGASESKKGLIEQANGGTAFFDEIGDLPLDLQVKLLRVLQEREYRPVGSLIRHSVDLRVIAATHRDLTQEVEHGRFRQDLFYRLNVVTLRIPPLRERREDILPLAEHFLGRLGVEHTLTGEVKAALLDYDWPGNVRELYNCVQRMTAMNSGPLLHTSDLPSSMQNHSMAKKLETLAMAAGAGAASSAPVAPAPSPMPPARARWSSVPDVPISPVSNRTILPLVEVERRAILEALEFTRGDRTMAAHLLGIGRTTLYRKLKEYAIAS